LPLPYPIEEGVKKLGYPIVELDAEVKVKGATAF